MSNKKRGPSVEQRGDIEMPPLDYVMPKDLGGSGVIETPQEIQQVHDYAQDQSMEQEEPEETQEVYSEVEQEVELDPRSTPDIKKQKTQQENFKEVRMAKERAERERDALMSQMLDMQSKLQANQQNNQQVKQPIVEEREWFDDLDPESLVEGKQLQKVAQDFKAMKKQLQQQQAQSQQLATEAKIRSQYPDFDQVFNSGTITSLNEMYPDVANALRVMPDDYNKATAAYTMIKNLGIYKGNEVKKPAYESDVLKAKVNASKPRPLTSVNPQQGDSPLSKANAFANGLTKELKEQMLKEMNEARKGH